MKPALFAGATLLGLTHLAAVTPAEACSLIDPQTSVLMPRDGAVDVPTNARVWIHVTSATHLGVLRVALRTAAGEEVEASVEAVPGPNRYDELYVVRPYAPLAPDTTYELFDPQAKRACGGNARCISSPPPARGSFTTGAGDAPASVEPEFADAVPAVTVGERLVESSSCGKFNHLRFALTWPAATDDDGVLYQIASATTGQVVASTHETRANGALRCSTDPSIVEPYELLGNDTYVVRAYDVTGQMIESAPVVVDVTCPPAPVDPPVDPGDDVEFSACTIGAPGGASPTSAGLIVAGFAFALVVARRRRRA